MRCLKRHLAREVYRRLVRPEAVPAGSDLRATRLSARISLQTVADSLGRWPTRISELERGLTYDTALARGYLAWLVAHGEDAPKAKRAHVLSSGRCCTDWFTWPLHNIKA